MILYILQIGGENNIPEASRFAILIPLAPAPRHGIPDFQQKKVMLACALIFV